MSSDVAVEELKEETVGELVEKFVELRDYLSLERKAFKELETKLKQDMEIIEMKILERQKELGLTSISTDMYTAYQTTKEFYRVGNWDKILEFMISSGNYQMLEKRIGKLATKEIIETMEIEPTSIGVDYSSELHVQVRKK